MRLDALTGKYTWVKEIEAWTVSVMRWRRIEEVVQIYGRGQAEPLGHLTFTDVDQHRGPDTSRIELFVQVFEYGEHTITLENNGWSGSCPEIARRCSAGGGTFFSVCWNIHAAGMVTQASDGTIVASFESLFSIEPGPRGGDRRPEWAIGPEVEPGMAWQVCMAQLEQQTGIVVEREWLTEPYPTYRIPEPYWLYRDVEGADRI